MSTEIVNAKSDPSPGGPAHYHAVKSRRYSKSAETVAKQNAFLKAYARRGTITHAARDAGVPVSYHYNWLEIDPDYPQKFKLAHQEAVEELEAEARRRAIEGVEEATGWYKGVPGGFVQRYSDTLLIFLLKGALPDKYKDRHEHTGKNGGPIEVQSTVTIEQFPVWLKQAIVVISSGVAIDGELEASLKAHFEEKFLECERLKLIGNAAGKGERDYVDVESSVVETVEMSAETPATVGETEASTTTTTKDYRLQATKAGLDLDDI
jgi:hypothetical protein